MAETRKHVDLYTDGACSGNPGKGGYGGILIYKNKEKEYSGYNANTTNNRMEITAVIEGLKLLKESVDIDIYSDSAYTVNAFLEGWIDNWQANNWRTAGKKPVQNIELWQRIVFQVGFCIVPLVLFILTFIIIKTKYKLDENEHSRIVKEIENRKNENTSL